MLFILTYCAASVKACLRHSPREIQRPAQPPDAHTPLPTTAPAKSFWISFQKLTISPHFLDFIPKTSNQQESLSIGPSSAAEAVCCYARPQGNAAKSLRNQLEAMFAIIAGYRFFEKPCRQTTTCRSRVVAATCAQFSKKRWRIAATWARVAWPCGSRVVAVVPLIRPSALAHCMTSTAHALGWSL